MAMKRLLALIVWGVAVSAAAQTITEFPVPKIGTGIRDLTVGPDGALWFTESNGNANSIGRMTSWG